MRLLSATGAAFAAALFVGGVATDAAASDRWRYQEFRGGALAQSCGGAGAYTACATVSCGADGVIRFGLDGLSGSAPIRPDGLLTSGGYRDRVVWRRLPQARGGGQDVLATGVNTGALVTQLKRGSVLGAVINNNIGRARGEIIFTLNGSSRAISQLEARCARLATRTDGGPRPDRGPIIAEATSPWRYVRFENGGVARSCGRFGQREICAAFYCDPRGDLRFGVDGLRENRSTTRNGGVAVGRYARNTRFDLEPGPRGGQQIYAGALPSGELADRVRGGRELIVRIEPRDRPLVFTLNGSRRALDEVERRCDQIADRFRRPNTTAWRYSEFRGGGKAESCGRFGDREICAVMYCLRGSGLQFGVNGLRERNRQSRRGALRVDGRERNVLFELVEGPSQGAEIYAANHPNPTRFANRLRAGSELEVAIEPRRRPLSFRLANSRRALDNLERRCANVAARRELRQEGRDERRVIGRYVDEIVGAWAVDPAGCAAGRAWVFRETTLSTPDGALCERVQVRNAGDLIAVRGVECRGGQRTRRGQDRVFEARRGGGERLFLVDVDATREIRLGENVVIQLDRGERGLRLVACR